MAQWRVENRDKRAHSGGHTVEGTQRRAHSGGYTEEGTQWRVHSGGHTVEGTQRRAHSGGHTVEGTDYRCSEQVPHTTLHSRLCSAYVLITQVMQYLSRTLPLLIQECITPYSTSGNGSQSTSGTRNDAMHWAEEPPTSTHRGQLYAPPHPTPG